MKWFQILHTNSFICKQLNGSKSCNDIVIIQFLHTFKGFQVLLFNFYHSIQHNAFVWTLFDGSKYCYPSLTILFSISHLFTQSQMVKNSIWPIDATLSGSTALDLSGPWSNGDKEVLDIFQNSSIRASTSDAVLCHIQDTRWRWVPYISAEMQSVDKTELVWFYFFCLMAYQLSWVI